MRETSTHTSKEYRLKYNAQYKNFRYEMHECLDNFNKIVFMQKSIKSELRFKSFGRVKIGPAEKKEKLPAEKNGVGRY